MTLLVTADDLISRTHKPEKELKRVSENEMTTMKPVIQKGDVVCLADLLFTRNRDSLVKNNNQQVGIYPLYLTHVIHILFFSLPSPSN